MRLCVRARGTATGNRPENRKRPGRFHVRAKGHAWLLPALTGQGCAGAGLYSRLRIGGNLQQVRETATQGLANQVQVVQANPGGALIVKLADCVFAYPRHSGEVRLGQPSFAKSG